MPTFLLTGQQWVGIVLILISFALIPLLLNFFLPSYRVEGFHAPQCVHPNTPTRDAITSDDVHEYNLLADRIYQLYSALTPMKTQLCEVVAFAKESNVKDRTAVLMEETGTAPTETGDAPENIKQKARVELEEEHKIFEFCDSSSKTQITFSMEPIYVSTEMSYSLGVDHANALLHKIRSMQSVLGYSQWEPALNAIEPDLKATSLSAANAIDTPEEFKTTGSSMKPDFDAIRSQIKTSIESLEIAHGMLERIETNSYMKVQIEQIGAKAKKNEEKQSNAITTA